MALEALTVYVIGLCVQFPFLATHFYTGPLVDPLGGADISWLVGLAVPAALYWLLCRNDTAHIPERTVLAPPGDGGPAPEAAPLAAQPPG